MKVVRYFAFIWLAAMLAGTVGLPSLKNQHLVALHIITATVAITFVIALYAFGYEDGFTKKAIIIGGIIVAAVFNSLEILFLMYQEWAFILISICLFWFYYLVASTRS